MKHDSSSFAKRWLVAALLVPLAAFTDAACALLESASQCATDDDCASFDDAVCDTAQAICVPRGTLDAAPDDSPNAPDEDGGLSTEVDAGLDPACLVPSKPTESATAGLEPASADGGVKLGGNVTLGCDKDWTLDKLLVVPSNSTLTIAAGTTIKAVKGTSAGIVVLQGGRIVAKGQKNAPIVMTVDDPTPKLGDWGGVIVLGNAPRTGTNPYRDDPLLQYGGQNTNDESGALELVRIEYSTHGLVLAGVGRGTKVDGVQVRHPSDNCFSINGGNVDLKHLVCQRALDEQFELQFGYTGRMQFLFGTAVDPARADAHGILADGLSTSPVIYNATLCGTDRGTRATGQGIVVRNDTKLDANNLILMGWDSALDAQSANLGTPLLLRSSIAFDNTTNPVTNDNGQDDDGNFDEASFFVDGGNAATNPNIVDCYNATAPKPHPSAALTTNARPPPDDMFFDPAATYVGAFKDSTDDWLTGWTRFDDK